MGNKIDTQYIIYDREAGRLLKITPFDVSSWNLHLWKQNRWEFHDNIGEESTKQLLTLENSEIFERVKICFCLDRDIETREKLYPKQAEE